ncbi:hypothetical protein LUZ60_015036 [Juncus effusus]|nr:hypothetical protein LUZ60_015036 [Juncus effusus]
MDNFKGLVKSSERFLKSALNNDLNDNTHKKNFNHNPVDILKRLQREAFSELMKLRDRQEKLEKSLLFHKFSSPFQKSSAHVKAAFNVIGSLLIFDDDFVDSTDRLERYGTKTGVSSIFTFETDVRERDNLIAEFGTTGIGSFGLNRLMYNANLNDFLSLVLIPFGARCNNFRFDSNFKQGSSDANFTNSPPLFQQFHNCAIGLTLKGHNFRASIAQLIGPSMVNTESADMKNCHLTTFGEIAYKPLEDIKISLSTLFQICKPSSHLVKISNLSFPLIHLKKSIRSVVLLQSTGTDTDTGTGIDTGIDTGTGTNSSQSIALNLNCEYLESTKLEGWIELNKPLSENMIKFGGSLCDLPENEIGWGLRSGGVIKGNFERIEGFQMEGFLNFELGRGGNAKLQPGVVFVSGGGNRVAALVLRSCWYM